MSSSFPFSVFSHTHPASASPNFPGIVRYPALFISPFPLPFPVPPHSALRIVYFFPPFILPSAVNIPSISGPSGRLLRLLPPLLVFFAAFALFAPSIAYPLLNYDDTVFISRNHLVLDGLSLRSVWQAFTTLHGDAAMYSPLLWIFWMFDVSVFGASPGNPWPFHFGNVFLHALNAVLLYFILRRCRATSLAAVLLSLLWACHPLRVESVAWVTERKDTLSTLFAFLSILCYLDAFIPTKDMGTDPLPSTCHPSLATCHCRKGRLYLALAAFVAGLLVKPMLVTLPFLFLLFDIFPLRRISLSAPFSSRALLRLVDEKLPLLFLSAAAAILSVLTQARLIHHDLSLPARIALVPLHYAFYLAKTFLPVRLAPFYPPIGFSWSAFVSVCILFAILFISVWRFRARHPAWSLGTLAFFGLFVPVIGFFHVGVHPFADRYTYLPSIGLSLAAIPLLSAASRSLRGTAAAVAALALFALLPATASTLRTWSSQEAFYARAGAVFSTHPYVVFGRARQLIADRGDFAAAESLVDEALASYPDHDTLRTLKALCLDERLGPGEAFDWLTSIDIGFTAYELREAAQYALRAGRYETVPAIVDDLLRSLPESDALVRDALYLRLAAAIGACDEDAIAWAAARIPELADRSAVAFTDLFPCYMNQWRYLHRRDAWAFFKACATRPGNTLADLNNIAWFLATAPGWNPAPPGDVLAIAQRAVDLAPGHPVLLDTLAAAQANASDFPAAVETAQRALGLAASDPDLAAKIRSRLGNYLQSRPFRTEN